MADRKPARKVTRTPAATTAAGAVDDESIVLAKLAEMSAADRAMGERIHSLVKATAPELSPRLWYGMPAYARNGAIVCFFQGAQKFKTRYSTLGFTDKATLDDGEMWPVAFALTELTTAVEARIVALVNEAVCSSEDRGAPRSLHRGRLADDALNRST